LAVEPKAIGEHEPALDPAFLLAVTVMVHDAMNPVAPELAIMTAAHQGRVLARNGGLVAVAVERPGLQLALIQLSAMQQLMEGMLVVVALGADGAKLLLKLLGTHDLGHGIVSRVAQCLARIRVTVTRSDRLVARQWPGNNSKLPATCSHGTYFV